MEWRQKTNFHSQDLYLHILSVNLLHCADNYIKKKDKEWWITHCETKHEQREMQLTFSRVGLIFYILTVLPYSTQYHHYHQSFSNLLNVSDISPVYLHSAAEWFGCSSSLYGIGQNFSDLRSRFQPRPFVGWILR